MKKNTRTFHGVPKGGICTATIRLLGLSAKKLEKDKVVERQTIRHDGCSSTEEYVFRGYSEEDA